MARKTYSRKIALLFVVIVFAAGSWVSTMVFADTIDSLKKQLLKFQMVISYAKNYYVEEIDWSKAITGAINGMLEELDPHSVYIDKKAAKANEESFSGKYEGIGIQFDVIDGYITVVAAFVGSPAYKVGLESGDKIVKIDGKSAVGIKRDEVPKKLKGPAGTVVHVSVSRVGIEKLLEFDIERAAIPMNSVVSSFMWDKKTGYIQLNRFMATTGDEIEKAMDELEARGMKRMILDLRGNPGGYLREAVKVAGKFLPGHLEVVYTKDRSGSIASQLFSDTFSKEKTRKYPLIVLVNRSSASASEIVSGALQDYDRALIVGENTFGKGLVQREFGLPDGSKLRLTTAKYYIPSGRLIQKDYKGKNKTEYYMEEASADSASADSTHRPVFYTLRMKRKVFGGGGIYPDEIIQEQVYAKNTPFVIKLNSKRVFFETARKLIEDGLVKQRDEKEFLKTFKFTDKLLRRVADMAEEKGLKYDWEDFENDREFIRLRLTMEIVRSKYGIDQMYEVNHRLDNEVKKAVGFFDEAKKMIETFPFD
jgi:carboxyl-terminal processing protease